MSPKKDESQRAAEDFLAEAGAARSGLIAEFFSFLKDNKKWWLLPIIGVLAIFALLAIAVATGAAPFIYTMF